MKILFTVIWIIIIGAIIFFRVGHYWIEYKNKQAGRRYCEENELTFLKIKHYELHTRVYFKKDEIESWVNYETDKNYNIIWKKETPLEKIKIKEKNE